jgi:hypothetical protein
VEANAEPVVVTAYRPRKVCATCFGRLHHVPDDELSEPAAAAPSPAPFAASSTLAEDTGSGPASPNSGFLWLRLPRALVVP